MPKIQGENSEAKLIITAGETDITMTAENSLYTQHAFGKVAIGDVMRNSSDFDNITIKTGDERPDISFFRGRSEEDEVHARNFQALLQLMGQKGFPMHVNAIEVSELEVARFTKQLDERAQRESVDIDSDLEALLGNSGEDPDSNATSSTD